MAVARSLATLAFLALFLCPLAVAAAPAGWGVGERPVARRLQASATAAAAVDGESCTPEQANSPELRAAREKTITEVWALAAVSVGPYRRNITLQQETLANITTPDATLEVVGAGQFPGQIELLEYTLLIVPAFNSELVYVNERTFNGGCTWVTADTCNITFNDELAIKGQGLVTGPTTESIRFKPCSPLIHYVTSVFAGGAASIVLMAAGESGSAEAICNAALSACPGDLNPFPSVIDCVSFIRQLPAACEDGVHTLQGNTSACRLLHISAAVLDPLVHCPHIAPNSAKCKQDDCTPVSAYSAPAQTPTKELEFNTAPNSVRWAIAAVYLAVCLAGLLVALVLLARTRSLRHGLDARCKAPTAAFAAQPTVKRLKALATMLTRARSRSRRDSVSVAFRDLQLNVGGRRLLDGAWGHFKGGRLVALMGPSGAGKSTLLKLLMGRSQGGTFSGVREWYRSNGRRTNMEAVQQTVAFLRQDDTVVAGAYPLLTVQESLMFHASLVLPSGLSVEQRASKVQGVLEETLLGPASDTQICALSGGQTRRWALACCLLRDPKAILLDEPTSGLDATMALSVMRVLHSQAKAGRMVALSIHQPRAAIFGLFDDILVLSSKGGTAYFGPPADLVTTLEMRHSLLREAAAYASSRPHGALTTAVARQLAGAFTQVDRNSDGVLSRGDVAAFLAANPDSLLDAEATAMAAQLSTEQSLPQALDVLSEAVEELGLAPLQRLEDFLVVATEDAGWKLMSPQQRMWLQLLGTAVLRDVDGALDAGMEEEAGAPEYVESPGELVSDFFASKGASSLDSNRRLHELNSEAAAELDACLDTLGGRGPPLAAGTRTRRQLHRPTQRLSVAYRLCRWWGDRQWALKIAFPVGAWATAMLTLLMFPQLGTDKLKADYLFASALLTALAAISNTGFFNKSAPVVGERKQVWRQEFEDGTTSVLEATAFIYLLDCLADAVGTLLLFVPLFWGVGYSRGTAVGGFEAFVALLLFTGIVSSAGNLFYLLLKPTAAVLACGLWLAWNCLFAGVLIRVQDLFIIWRPWAAYCSPFFHVINIWVVAAFAGTDTDCKPKDFLMLCPPTGGYVLSEMQYADVPSTGSLSILFAFYVVQWALVAAALRWRYARFHPAKYLGPSISSKAGGEALLGSGLKSVKRSSPGGGSSLEREQKQKRSTEGDDAAAWVLGSSPLLPAAEEGAV